MSIVFLCHSAAPSGAELSLLRSIRQLPEPTNVTVIFAEGGPVADQLKDIGANTIVLPLNRGRKPVRRNGSRVRQIGAAVELLRYAGRVRKVLRELSPSVVVGRSLRAAIYGRVATWGLRARFVWSVHDCITRDYLGVAAPIYARLLPRMVDGIVVNSRTTLATLVIPPSRPVLVMPPALDLDDLEPSEPRSPLSKVAMVGRLSPWKGQHVAIEAFANSKLSSTASLDIVGAALFGEDEYAQSLHDIVRRHGLQQRVRFVGHVHNPRELLLDTDVLIHASVLPEPFGAVVVEGMYAKCLVVATAPGGPSESIANDLNGFLVPAGDAKALSKAMDRLVDMPDSERVSIAEAAREAARGYDSAILSGELFMWLESLGAPHQAMHVSVSSSLLGRR